MKRQKKYNLVLFLIILLLGLGLGYAALSADLNIEGITNLTKTTWDIHFENIHETAGGVTPNSTTSINAAEDTVTFNVTLSSPGQFYEFTVDAVNEGTVDGMIESFTSTLNGGSISALPDCLTYSATYSDGVAISQNHLLAANSSETYKIRVEFLEDITSSQLPDSNQTLNLSFTVNYVQADENATSPEHPEDFSTDSWGTIITAIRSGNISAYHVGDIKTVELGNDLGNHTLRIANTTTPSECSTAGFSQTACGFVLEFADIITDHRMNLYTYGDANLDGSTVNGTGNKGGWEYSDMRAFLNSTTYANENIDYSTTGIYSSLPVVLRNAIINTTVVSGHGSVDTTNYTTTDKLYLLSPHEVWKDADLDANAGIDYYDTAYNNTRQLDYYAGLNVTTSNYSGAIKQYNSSSNWWWLRSAFYDYDYISDFFCVSKDGPWTTDSVTTVFGVSPAFRIA